MPKRAKRSPPTVATHQIPSAIDNSSQPDDVSDSEQLGTRAYTALGVMLATNSGTGQAIGDCPFCHKDGKFYVNEVTGLFDCKVCQRRGNILGFLRLLWDQSKVATTTLDYQQLAQSRGLLTTDSLYHWGAAKSILTGKWLVPGYSYDKRLIQLYRWTNLKHPKTGRWKYRLLPTPGILDGNGNAYGTALFGNNTSYLPGLNDTYLCESLWDAVCLWEVLCHMGIVNQVNILATPGAGVFHTAWTGLFMDKNVYICTQNDEAALTGARKVTELLLGNSKPAKNIYYLDWRLMIPNGFDPIPPGLPAGYDIRDYLTRAPELPGRAALLQNYLTNWFTEVPDEWKAAAKERNVASVDTTLTCTTYAELREAWEEAMYWTAGLDRFLVCCLAVTTSTGHIGDQLWLKGISPPSTGKSTICEALAMAKHYTKSLSKWTGFYSGYKGGHGDTKDYSPLLDMKDRTLITKDADTLFKGVSFDVVMSEARDLYDRVARVDYKHGVKHNHENISITWILCGTAARLYEKDSSELGDRFLVCRVVDYIDEQMEDSINRSAATELIANLGVMVNGKPESIDSPQKARAKQLTGGYIHHLRKHASSLMRALYFPDTAIAKVNIYAKFVALMRARPSKTQEEVVEREMSTRLFKQLLLMAANIAVVLNKSSVDDEVMAIIRKVAIDTAIGRTLTICRHLHGVIDNAGMQVAILALHCGAEVKIKQKMLNFLANPHIGVVEVYNKNPGHMTDPPLWRLTPKMHRLYTEVFHQ